MPVITVTLIEGYDETVRQRLAERLTDAVSLTIGAPLDGITVMLPEVSPSGYMRGRRGKVPGAPPPSPADVVRDFLAAMQARELDRAKDYLAEGFKMTFPGGVEFETLEQLIDWSKSRYRSIGKTYDRFDEMPAPADNGGGAVVYCFGTLHGEQPDGKPFSGIRFIDRFTVRGPHLIDQSVWNDLAESL